MNKNLEVEEENISESTFDIVGFGYFLLKRWYWLLISIVLGVLFAFFIKRYTHNEYQSSAQVLLNMNKQDNPLAEITGQMGVSSRRNKFFNTDENELLVLKSKQVLSLAAKKLKLNIRYFSDGRISGISEIKKPKGILVALDSNKFKIYGSFIHLISKGNSTYTYKIKNTDSLADLEFRGEFGVFNFHGFKYEQKNDKITSLLFKALPLDESLNDLFSNMRVSSMEEESSVYKLVVSHQVPEYATMYANTLLKSFLEFTKNEKSKSNKEALIFVDNRLEELGDSLDKIESELTKFKKINRITDSRVVGEKIYDKYEKAKYNGD